MVEITYIFYSSMVTKSREVKLTTQIILLLCDRLQSYICSNFLSWWKYYWVMFVCLFVLTMSCYIAQVGLEFTLNLLLCPLYSETTVMNYYSYQHCKLLKSRLHLNFLIFTRHKFYVCI